MSLWHRAPREVYRVYGEDRYLDGEDDPQPAAATVEYDSSAEGASTPAPHAGRLVGLGLLVGVILATLIVVLLNASRPHGTTPGPLAQHAGVDSERRGSVPVGPSGVIDHASSIARGTIVWPPQRRASSAARPTPTRAPAWRPQHEEPAIVATVTVSAATVAPPEAAAPPIEDEFGFER